MVTPIACQLAAWINKSGYKYLPSSKYVHKFIYLGMIQSYLCNCLTFPTNNLPKALNLVWTTTLKANTSVHIFWYCLYSIYVVKYIHIYNEEKSKKSYTSRKYWFFFYIHFIFALIWFHGKIEAIDSLTLHCKYL